MNAKEQFVVLDNKLVQRTKATIKDCTSAEIVGVQMNDIQAKLINYIISTIKPTDNEFHEVQIAYSDFCNLIKLSRGGKTDENFRKMMMHMLFCAVVIETKDEIINFPWFSKISMNKHTNIITAKLNNELAPYLLGLMFRDGYFMYQLGNIVHLKKSSSIVLYQWLHSHLNHKCINISIDALKNSVFMFDPKKYAKTNDFIRKVINPAVEEINKNTDLIVEYKTNSHKDDKNPNPKITSLTFNVSSKSPLEYRKVKVEIWGMTNEEVDIAEKEREMNSRAVQQYKIKMLKDNDNIHTSIQVNSLAEDLINKHREKTKKKKEKKNAPSRGALPISNY